jgi:hypothetical protein
MTRDPGPGSPTAHAALILALALGALLPGAPAVARGAPPACCKDPSGFRYRPLELDTPVDFVIDRQSPTFEFQSGPSAFQAFALPVTDRPYRIEVQSFLSGPADVRRARVYYPVVAILNDDYLVSRSSDLDGLSFDLSVLERSDGPAYRASLPIEPAGSRERYLVVFTPSRLASGRVLPPISTPATATEAARVAFLGAAPYGRLRIALRPARQAPSVAVPAQERSEAPALRGQAPPGLVGAE